MAPAGAKKIDLELALQWRSRHGFHLDRQYFSDVDSRSDTIAGISLSALLDGPRNRPQELATGLRLAERDPAMVRELPVARWNGPPPQVGRQYPRRLLAGERPMDARPIRVLQRDAERLVVDLNSPLHGLALDIQTTVCGTRDVATDAPLLLPRDLLDLIAATGPGLQAALPSAETDFLSGDPFSRGDATDDSRFYADPRLVHHLDQPAREEIVRLHTRLLASGMTVLDLMASWNSHLPDDLDLAVTGLGMNAQELDQNPRLSARLCHDLNREARLPFSVNRFDAVVCTLSIEYLVRPVAVVAEAARVLKPGGLFLVTFSDRWFPTKAIRLWSELHAFERLALVMDFLRLSGGFEDLHTETLRGLPPPEGTRRPQGRPYADPLFAVWGYRVKRR